jgi:hypothetical protein
MLKRRTFESWLVLSALLFFSMGCGQLPKPPNSEPVTAAPKQGLSVQATGLQTAGQCQVVVQLKEPRVDLDLAVRVEAEPIIRFTDTMTWQSKPISFTIGANEARQIPFDCLLASENVTLSGEYIVTAYVVQQSSGQVYQTAETRLFVLVGENQVGPLLISEQEFDRQFTEDFIAGAGNLHYHFDFESSPYPTSGLLYLKIVGDGVNFAPELIAWVRGGIQFLPGPGQSSNVEIMTPDRIRLRFETIVPSGSRIAAVPFIMDARSLAGTYSLEIMQNNGGIAWGEEAPIMIEVADVAAVPGQHLLKEARLQQPRATESVSIAAFPTSPPPIPLSVTPTTAAPSTEPTPIPTAAPTPTNGAPIVQMMNLTWDQPLTSYYGSCRDVYNQRIEGKLSMTWEAFRAAVIQHNPDLANTNCMFDPFKQYWLPTAASAEAVR